MSKNIAEKIIEKHLVSGRIEAGQEIAVSVDQTLTQDATGTMVYLQFEALNVHRLKTKFSISYVDHNTLQTGFENADDHRFLQSMAAKYGAYFSRPGNGICHQIHLERFGVPGQTLLGSDSHTPNCGGLGMLAVGAGGLDVALAMAGHPFYMTMPKILLIRLIGKLRSWVTAKDLILEVLRQLSVKGGVGKIIEYGGPAIKSLSVPQRATITNMGAELGATTSLFPSDEVTRSFLKSQKREGCWVPLEADPSAFYHEELEIDLGKLEPMIAKPPSPDNVCRVQDVEGMKIDQVAIGSCTNSSYHNLMKVSEILKNRMVHPQVSLVISPGSRQVLQMLSLNGSLSGLIKAGARILECACGPCIGMGQAPPTSGISLRTFNRNFMGRSGTQDVQVFLAGVETAAASALAGVIADPRKMGIEPTIPIPETFFIDDTMIIPPSSDPDQVEIIRGPNIQPLSETKSLDDTLTGKILLKLGDDITTDHIIPAGAKILPLRSNIPAISKHIFEAIYPEFYRRAKQAQGGFIVAGINYGQGSSREHAALTCRYLGIKAVLAKTFARIHRANLINSGILPLIFVDDNDYDKIMVGDDIKIDVRLLNGGMKVQLINQDCDIAISNNLTDREMMILKKGGALAYFKN